MAIILQQTNQQTEAVIEIDPTPEQVREDDAAYYAQNWFDGYAIIAIVIGIFLVGLLARPLLFIASILIQIGIVFALIFFLVSYFAIS